MIAGLYQRGYGYFTSYIHPYVVIGVLFLVSAGIVTLVFWLFRNVYDRISDKWHDRWQYYEVTGVKELKEAVSVSLCVISITLAIIARINIPADINVVSWWIVFSVGLNMLYHGCCKRGCY